MQAMQTTTATDVDLATDDNDDDDNEDDDELLFVDEV